MDSHIIGPRQGAAYGSIVSGHIIYVKFGDQPSAGRDLFGTQGASPTTPLVVRVTGGIKTAFNATGVAAKITMSNLDGSGTEDIATLAALSKSVLLTQDKVIELVYTVGTGGSAGEVGYLVEVVGQGQLAL